MDKGVGTPSTTPAPGSPVPDADSVGTNYWNRKQDEAVTTLLKILQDERSHLVTRMQETFENNNRDGQSLLDAEASELLLKGIEKSVEKCEGDLGRVAARIVVEELKKNTPEPEHGRLFKQLQLFLFLLKREIQDVLRTRSIKPHWMFTFDDTISRAVQIILQQMGFSFDGGESTLERREYTSQTSTSQGSSGVAHYETASTRLVKLQDSSVMLMEQLIQAETRYQDLLKRSLCDKHQLIRLLEAQLMNQTKELPSTF